MMWEPQPLRFYPHDYIGEDWDDFLVVCLSGTTRQVVPAIGDIVIYKSKSNRNVVAKVVERTIPLFTFDPIELKVEILKVGEQ